MSDRARRALAAAAAVGVAVAALWHASPVVLWHTRFASQLAAQGDPSRLHSRLELADSVAEPRWARIANRGIQLRAPVDADQLDRCGECAERCLLQLTGGGTLALLDEEPPDYDETLDRFAPDAGDVSLFRSAPRNWRTIDALADRARQKTPPPASFRYAAEGSRGVVTAFEVDGTERFVVYAFGPATGARRIVGVTGLERGRLLALLSGLRIGPAPSCSS